jgi:hypothetical protein
MGYNAGHALGAIWTRQALPEQRLGVVNKNPLFKLFLSQQCKKEQSLDW